MTLASVETARQRRALLSSEKADHEKLKHEGRNCNANGQHKHGRRKTKKDHGSRTPLRVHGPQENARAAGLLVQLLFLLKVEDTETIALP